MQCSWQTIWSGMGKVYAILDVSIHFQVLNYLYSHLYICSMADQGNEYILRNREPKTEEPSFFSCMQCFPDDGELDFQSLSSTHSRRNLNKRSVHEPQPEISRTSHQIYIKASQLMDSRKSSSQRGEKISIKNRRPSNFQRQSIILPEREHIPNFLTNTCQPAVYGLSETEHSLISTVRGTNPPGEVRGSVNSEINGGTIRRSRPSVAFTYKQSPAINVPKSNNPHQGLLSPPKPYLSSASPNKPDYVPRELAPHLNQLGPKIVVSKQMQDHFAPIENSEFLNQLPQEQPHLLKLEFTDKGISELYKEKERDVYDSLEPISDLAKQSSSNEEPQLKKKKSSLGGHFGNGQNKLKVRQTVSIREPQEEDLHESIVIERSKDRGNLKGLLNPISQSDELGSTIGTTLFCRRPVADEDMLEDGI